MTATIERLERRRLLADTFFGRVSATFVNAEPAASAVTTGQDTSEFTFGQGQPDVTTLGFQGRPFHDKVPSEIFWLGTLNYTNGEIASGTEATSVVLRIIVTMTQPAFSQPIAFDFPLGLISTPNDPNPLEPDYVQLLPPGGFSGTFTADDGGTYTLEILGFSQSSGAGYNQLKEFYIEEGGSATARLVGSIVPKPRILIIAPKRDAKRAYISEDAKMPALVLQVLGIPDDQRDSLEIHWRLTLHTRAKDSPFGLTIDGIQLGNVRRGDTYKPNFGDVVVGGRLAVSCFFDLNGERFTLLTSGLRIAAHNPSEEGVNDYLSAQPVPAHWPQRSGYDYRQVLRKIIRQSSGYRQFTEDGQPRWSPDGHHKVGLFQVPGDELPDPDIKWNWKANIDDGVFRFSNALIAAAAWPDDQLSRLAPFASRLADIRDEHGLDEPIGVAPFTAAMTVREAIERFASGNKYRLLGKNEEFSSLRMVYNQADTIGTILWRDVSGADGNPFCDQVLAQAD